MSVVMVAREGCADGLHGLRSADQTSTFDSVVRDFEEAYEKVTGEGLNLETKLQLRGMRRVALASPPRFCDVYSFSCASCCVRLNSPNPIPPNDMPSSLALPLALPPHTRNSQGSMSPSP
jgi:hypothetical protein